MADRAACPFHAGEQEMHFKTGVWQAVESLGRRMIKPAIGPVHADLLRTLPMLLVTAQDSGGRAWASALVGSPGFLSKRTLQLVDAPPAGSSADPERGTGTLGAAQQAMVAAADTFFIASSSGPLSSNDEEKGGDAAAQGSLPAVAAAFGHDISHRGGPPGFVQVEEQGRVLRWGDYEGNFMFNTLGNLLVHPACALLFLDFSSSDVLMAAGDAEVLHKDRELPGAHRAVRFTVQEWAHLRGELPLRQQGEPEPSPFNPSAQ
ncbi:hypothetical protein COHA_007687 [Chlorella ohadii]|uniref:Uncharacterized protein n=1 Tax=Chlorella ohadii TaxID=2649997 RepID=A0AAD5DQC0_9CHLO|nr:hypothetical protein COHA_007687 [Chlorella ohadii]